MGRRVTGKFAPFTAIRSTFSSFALMCSRATMRVMVEPRSFPQFWTFYVLAHRQPLTRNLHTVGTLAGWLLLATAIVLRRPWFVLAALLVPYAFAWFSHFFVEHNRPATFGHPLWSWLADQKMVALVLAGKMNREVQRCAALESVASGN